MYLAHNVINHRILPRTTSRLACQWDPWFYGRDAWQSENRAGNRTHHVRSGYYQQLLRILFEYDSFFI